MGGGPAENVAAQPMATAADDERGERAGADASSGAGHVHGRANVAAVGTHFGRTGRVRLAGGYVTYKVIYNIRI